MPQNDFIMNIRGPKGSKVLLEFCILLCENLLDIKLISKNVDLFQAVIETNQFFSGVYIFTWSLYKLILVVSFTFFYFICIQIRRTNSASSIILR